MNQTQTGEDPSCLRKSLLLPAETAASATRPHLNLAAPTLESSSAPPRSSLGDNLWARTASHSSAYSYFNGKFGRLDILVNNAGIAGGTFPGTGPEHRASDVPLDLLHQIFETNFFSTVALTKALLPLIKKSPAGRIVNLSSILGSLTLQSDPKSPIYHAKSFAYDASKSALNAFTVHLAYELRDTKIKSTPGLPGW